MTPDTPQPVASPTPGAAPPAPASDLGVVPGLIWAFRIVDDGSAAPLPTDQPIPRPHQGWLWLHFDLASVPATSWLAAADLPPQAVALMLSFDSHQQLHAAGTVLYGILVDLVRDLHGAGDDVDFLRFIMTEQMLVTGRRRSLAAVETTKDTLLAGDSRPRHCASLLELIIEHVADGVETVADDLAGKLDEIEEQLAVKSIGPARRNLANVRRTSVRLHRHLSGLQAVLNRLERQDAATVNIKLQFRVNRLAQRLEALDRVILEIRERGYRLQDEVSATIAEETNRHLHLLSILTTLLLPATFVAGIFGMNTKWLPFINEDGGFWWVMGMVGGSSIVTYLVLRVIGVFKPRE
ncbi:MAG: CorA family divalent cation transporter [Reyranellaceae bacterium]